MFGGGLRSMLATAKRKRRYVELTETAIDAQLLHVSQICDQRSGPVAIFAGHVGCRNDTS